MDRETRGELGLSLAALAGSLLLNAAALRYVEIAGSRASPNPDILLGLLPVVDTRPVYVWGAAGFIVLAIAACLTVERDRAAYIARLYAALIAVRSGVMVLTPMHVPAGEMGLDGHTAQAVARFFTAHNDLFFSLHTALPFLGFLAFRATALKRACLGFSIGLAAAVLLGRNHYSVDVAGAYLITYSVFRLVPAPVWPEPARPQGAPAGRPLRSGPAVPSDPAETAALNQA